MLGLIEVPKTPQNVNCSGCNICSYDKKSVPSCLCLWDLWKIEDERLLVPIPHPHPHNNLYLKSTDYALVHLFIWNVIWHRKQSNNQLSSICPAQPLEMFHYELPHRTEPPLTSVHKRSPMADQTKVIKDGYQNSLEFLDSGCIHMHLQ